MKKLYIYTLTFLTSLLGFSFNSAVAQSLTVSGVPAVICANEAFTLGYSSSGLIINTDNFYYVQLSTDNFFTTAEIGFVTTQATDGTIYVVIPDDIPFASNYRIRVVANSTDLGAFAGLDNGLDININCTTRDYYWVGGAGDWSDISHWEYTTDDVSFFFAAEPPNSNDNVNFDDLSFPNGGTLNVDIEAYCNDMYWDPSVTTSPQLFAPNYVSINVRGDLIMADGVYKDVYRFAFNSEKENITIYLADNTSKLNSNVFWDGDFDFYGNGSYSLESPLKGNRIRQFNNTSFDTNGNSLDLSFEIAMFDITANFYAQSSTINLWKTHFYGTFDAGTSSIVFNKGGGVIEGNAYFHDVVLEAGDFSIYGNDSILNLTLMPDVKLKISPFANLAVTGSFQALGSRSKMIDIQSTDVGDPSYLKLYSATSLVNFVILQDNTVTSTSQPVSASNSINNGNNTNWSIASIAPQSYFWIGGSGNWSDVNHWATTDGGTTLRTDPPGPVDNVNFTTNSFPNGGHLTIDVAASCNDFIWTDGPSNPSVGAAPEFPLTVRGDFELPAGITRSIFDLRFESVTDNFITFSDSEVYFQGTISFEGSGSWSLQDSVSSQTINVYSGTLFTNNNTLNISYSFYLGGGMTNLGSSIINVGNLQGNGIFLNAESSTLIFSNNGGISLNGASLNNVIFTGDNSFIWNSNNFENITINAGADLRLESGSTQNFNQSLTINGTRSNMATLRSDSPGNQAFFNATFGAVVTAAYVNLFDNNAVGTTFNALNSTDNGNNPGWNITAIIPMNYYWINGPGNWSDYENHWSNVSGGGPNVMDDAPGQLDDVFFTSLSSFVLSSTDTVTLDIPASVHTMTWEDGSEKPTIDDGNNNPLTITGSLLMTSGVQRSINRIYFESSATNNLIDLADNEGTDMGNFNFDGGGTWTALDSISAFGMAIQSGLFNTNNNNMYVNGILESYDQIDFGSSIIKLFYFFGNAPAAAGGETIYIEQSGTLRSQGGFLNNVIFEGSAAIRDVNNINNFTAQEAGSTLKFYAGSSTTINSSLNLNGAIGAPIVIDSDSPGSQSNISMPGSATVNADFIHLYDNNAFGGAVFTATNSAQFSNVTGWTGLLSGQTISLTTVDVPFSDGPVTLNGSSSSGLDVQYSITQGDASISGNVVTPNSPGLVGISVTQNGSSTFAEALGLQRYIHFNATNEPNEIGNMKAASYVVGQVDFVSNELFFDVNKTPRARQALVTADGKLITTGSRRVLIWNQVPNEANVPADIVLGQPDFISSNFQIDASTLYSSSYSVGMADDGRLLVADSRGILIWNTFPTENGQKADVIIGQNDFNSADFGPGANRFNGPGFFTITPDQKLIVSDLVGGRVLIFNQIPTENNASADIVLGQADFDTNTAGAGQAGMNYPSYPTVDADGRLYIPDANNNRVLVYNSVPTVSGTLPDHVLGQPDFDTNIEDVVTGLIFNYPYSVSISRTGKMAIADRQNSRVLVYNSVPGDNTVEPDFVLGQPNLTTDPNSGGFDITNRSFSNPYAVYWDAAENLFVGDVIDNRYLVWGAPDFDVPTVDNIDLPQPYISESGVKAVFTLGERSGLQQADAYFRFISSPDPAYLEGGLVEESENVWSFDLTGIDIVDEPLGMEFYIDIIDGYGNAFDNSANPLTTNIEFPSGLPITEFGVGSAATNYRLFAVPLELDNQNALNVFDEVFAGAYDKAKMRIFSFSGGTATTFTEYESGLTNLELGKGYFGLAANNTTVMSGTGHTVPYHNQGLGSGWQLIGNPYNFTLNWSDIEAASGFDSNDVQLPRGYDDGAYTTDQAQIGPGEGVFVLNKGGGTLNLVFPVANNVGGRIMEKEDNINDLSSDSWEVRFLRGIGDQEHQVGAIGMEVDAIQSIDQYDKATPPAIGPMGSIIFNHPEYFVTAFDVDKKPTSASDNWAFTFTTGENTDNEEELSWDNSYYGYNTPDIFLVDKTHFEVINMKENDSYQFKHSGETEFEVYYGENALSSLLPESLEVQTPYPNPFKEAVKINVGLPLASNDYKVVVAIYNTMGKQVTTLNNAEMNGGFYSFNWQGTNDSGQPVAAGIYAYRIITSGDVNNIATGKIIKE